MDSSTPMTRTTGGLLRRRASLIAWITVLTVAVAFDVALVRDDSSSPNDVLGVGLGLLAGFGLGVAVAYVWDRSTGRLTRIFDVERATGLRVLAVIPTLRPDADDRVAVTASEPTEGVEAFGSLTAGLTGAVREADGTQCLLVTSPTRRAGRTTIAANLAASFAAEGMRVALIAADTRGEPVDAMLGIEPRPGLTDVLDGRHSLDEAIQDSGIERLSVLVSGPPTERGAVGYNLDELARLLERMVRDYDLVVIDAPPVLGSLETVLLAQDADLVLFAVDVRHGRRADATAAASHLEHVADRVVGVVANDPGRPPRSAGPLTVAVRDAVEKRHRWVAAVAVAVAAALVVSAAWWLSEDGRSQAQQQDQSRPESRLQPVAEMSTSIAQAPIDAAVAECRSSWKAQAVPLAAADASLDQWQVHVDAMNQLVAGEITLDQASAFWARTRTAAAAKVDRFLDADGAYTRGEHTCETPSGASESTADLSALRSCRRGVAAREEALRAARVSIETWHHHVMDMELLRAGRLTPDQAVQRWLENWKQGVGELKDYRRELRQTRDETCAVR